MGNNWVIWIVILYLLNEKNNRTNNSGNDSANANESVLEIKGSGTVYGKTRINLDNIISQDTNAVEYNSGIIRFKQQTTYIFEFEFQVESGQTGNIAFKIEGLNPPAILYTTSKYVTEGEKTTIKGYTMFWPTDGDYYVLNGDVNGCFDYTGTLVIKKAF